MLHFNILKVEKAEPNEEGKVCIYNEYAKQYIELPYPEIDREVILITANSILRELDVETMSVVTANYSEIIGDGTVYFLRPFSQEDFEYFEYLMTHFKSDKETWVPFLPEEKELIWMRPSDGMLISFLKNIRFNDSWIPVSHMPYVERINEEVQQALEEEEGYLEEEGDLDMEDYIDFMDYDIEVFKRDDSVSDNTPLMKKISSEVFNHEFFGDDEYSENLNNDKDDITACLDKLFGED